MKGITQATIIANEALTPDVYQLRVRLDGEEALVAFAAIQPGQFVNVYTGDSAMLLPRPFGIADIGDGEIEIVYEVVGGGTELLSQRLIGDKLSILGPQGNGFDMSEIGRRVLLVGGGLGIAPLRFAASALKKLGEVEVTAVLGYPQGAFYDAGFIADCDAVYRISERDQKVDKHFGLTGNVMDMLATLVSKGEINLEDAMVWTCGPTPMMRAICIWASEHGLRTRVSLEARMGCGYGACVGCTVAATDGSRLKVCTDGPVFDGTAVTDMTL